jgi:hypothetical protein
MYEYRNGPYAIIGQTPSADQQEVMSAIQQRDRIRDPATQRAIYSLWQGTTGGNADYVKSISGYRNIGLVIGALLGGTIVYLSMRK